MTTGTLRSGPSIFNNVKFRWNVIRACMNAHFEQSRRRTLGQINNGLASMVPAARSLQATRSAEVTMAADHPEGHQMNMPSSIWIGNSSTIRLPVSVFRRESGVRPSSRGCGLRSQPRARSRAP